MKFREERVCVSPRKTKTITKVIKNAVYKNVKKGTLGGCEVKIISKDIVLIDYKRIKRETLEAILSGNLEGAKGIKTRYQTERFLIEDVEHDGIVIPKGAKIVAGDWRDYRRAKVGRWVIMLERFTIPKESLKAIKTPIEYELSGVFGYKVSLHKNSVAVGCRKFTYKGIKAILAEMDKEKS